MSTKSNLFDRVLAKNWRIENFSFAAFVVLVNTIIHCRSATLPEWLFRIHKKKCMISHWVTGDYSIDLKELLKRTIFSSAASTLDFLETFLKQF